MHPNSFSSVCVCVCVSLSLFILSRLSSNL
jgi:hypothetical protein